MTIQYPIITLKKGKEKSVLARHPWIFSGAIAKEPNGLKEGTIVSVNDSNGIYLATGHFHKATISVRCLNFDNSPIDATFWNNTISKAFQFRKIIGLANNNHTNIYRLVHGEGDGCPGLVIDIYGKTAIIQVYTKGMYDSISMIKDALLHTFKDSIKAIYSKSAETLAKHGVSNIADEYLYKSDDFIEEDFGIENNLKFKINYIEGQKTGFFIDQRNNRSLVQHYANDKTVLNTFCYTGGFSLYALQGGAKKVVSVDSSKKAMEGVQANVKLNFPKGQHEGITEDVMTYLKKSKESFDLIILDSPAYAKHLSQVKNAMVGYRNLNTEGLKKVNKGGIIFTFSCSQAIDKELFRKIIFQSALQAGRNVRILHQLSQPEDHPISIYHPESEYLKGFVLYVD
ncbi:MAG: class I SAM-dependent rRNA methyltransferase [Bacteroidota bacterium]